MLERVVTACLPDHRAPGTAEICVLADARSAYISPAPDICAAAAQACRSGGCRPVTGGRRDRERRRRGDRQREGRQDRRKSRPRPVRDPACRRRPSVRLRRDRVHASAAGEGHSEGCRRGRRDLPRRRAGMAPYHGKARRRGPRDHATGGLAVVSNGRPLHPEAGGEGSSAVVLVAEQPNQPDQQDNGEQPLSPESQQERKYQHEYARDPRGGK